MATIRDPDGLAMSTRNTYLNPQQREVAPVLRQALLLAEEMWTRGLRDAEAIRGRMREFIAAEPLASLDYVSVAQPDIFEELDRVHGRALVSLAVRIGDRPLDRQHRTRGIINHGC